MSIFKTYLNKREDALNDLHYELHMSTPPICEWGALLKDETLYTETFTHIEGEGSRIKRFRYPSQAAKYGQPVLILVRPHGKYCGCAPIYDFQRETRS